MQLREETRCRLFLLTVASIPISGLHLALRLFAPVLRQRTLHPVHFLEPPFGGPLRERFARTGFHEIALAGGTLPRCTFLGHSATGCNRDTAAERFSNSIDVLK